MILVSGFPARVLPCKDRLHKHKQKQQRHGKIIKQSNRFVGLSHITANYLITLI